MGLLSDMPVMFPPPEFCRSLTSPAATGSVTPVNTMGRSLIFWAAACGAGGGDGQDQVGLLAHDLADDLGVGGHVALGDVHVVGHIKALFGFSLSTTPLRMASRAGCSTIWVTEMCITLGKRCGGKQHDGRRDQDNFLHGIGSFSNFLQ